MAGGVDDEVVAVAPSLQAVSDSKPGARLDAAAAGAMGTVAGMSLSGITRLGAFTKGTRLDDASA